MQKEKELQITLRNVSKKYGEHSILENISLDIYKGDFVCIFGKSGGGKTTLLNIIGTLENYDSGSVTCFSNRDPIKDPKAGELLRREKIAYLFQNFALVEKMTVEENMMLAAKYNQEKNKKNLIEAALNKMGISDKLKSKVYELSGGEQQRVALARNMIKPFEIMLADEPTGSLDSQSQENVLEIFKELAEAGKTVIIVTHNPEVADYADVVIKMKDGEVVETIEK